jgi:uncharacterized protein
LKDWPIKSVSIHKYRFIVICTSGGFLRRVALREIPNKIKVVIGMRRTGKTFFLMQTIRALLKKNVALSQVLFLNFEDDRLVPISQKKLGDLVDEFYTLYPENHDKTCYLFFDEIQNVEGWPLIIRRFFDTKKVQLFLTGSSAKLLSKEIATSLRGRSIATEMWPFNFKEYLLAKGIDLPNKINGKKARDQLLPHLKNYLHDGGFPETIFLEMPDRVRILQDYVNVVIFRDVIERYHISNLSLIKYMIKSLIKNAATPFSVNKFFTDLKSQGFSVGNATIYEYLNYIEDAYLAFSVPLYSDSIRKIQSNPKKIYIIDPGLINAYLLSHNTNMGHLFENLIYLDLRRKDHEIYYYLTAERYEIDFLTKDIYGKLHLFQVVWDASDPVTMQREKRALAAAEAELGIKGEIITPDKYWEWLQK